MNRSQQIFNVLLTIALFIIFYLLLTGNKDGGYIDYSKQVDSLKMEINEHKKANDSLKILASRKDSVRENIVTRYKIIKIKSDSIPCDSALPQIINVCDSIIVIDSTEIKIKDEIILNDSIIIADQSNIIKNDSLIIADKNKEIKFQKRQKWRFLAGGGIIGFIAGKLK